jgi:hypothetical protein
MRLAMVNERLDVKEENLLITAQQMERPGDFFAAGLPASRWSAWLISRAEIINCVWRGGPVRTIIICYGTDDGNSNFALGGAA